MNTQKQINAFNAAVASLQGLTELILISLPVSDQLADFESSVYEGLSYLHDAQKILKRLPDGFAPSPALPSGVLGQGTIL